MGILGLLRSRIPRTLKNRLKDSRLNYFRLYFGELKMKYFGPRYFGQTAEDAILGIYLPEKKGFYLDIGAGRPIKGSNTYALYLRGWTGICVDPISVNSRLQRAFRRKDTIVNILIGPRESVIDFWEFEPYEYSTADVAVAGQVIKYDGIRLLSQAKKEVKPLSSIAPEASPFDAALLSIDVEGFDLEVLKSNDWDKFRPRVICVEEWEATMDEHLNSEVAAFLKLKNYERKAWTGLSSIFVEKNYLDLMPKR